jgi:hypothetical protein
MRTSFHHQPEAQHPNFPLSTSRQADYPIFWGQSGHTQAFGLNGFVRLVSAVVLLKRGARLWQRPTARSPSIK